MDNLPNMCFYSHLLIHLNNDIFFSFAQQAVYYFSSPCSLWMEPWRSPQLQMYRNRRTNEPAWTIELSHKMNKTTGAQLEPYQSEPAKDCKSIL